MCLFSAALSLPCCVCGFSSCSEQGLLFIVVCGLLVAVASLVVGLSGMRSSVAAVCGLHWLWCFGLVAL